jgi:hypothetical protein
MKIKEKSKSKRLMEAVAEDGINYIIGFSRIPIFSRTAIEFLKIRKEESPINFVDWQLKEWPLLYSNEIPSAVQFSYKGKEFLLPQILIFEKDLHLSQIILRCSSKAFQLRDDAKALTEDSFETLRHYLRNKRSYSNDENLRLTNIIEEDEKVIFEVQSVTYEYYLHTNLVLDARPKGKTETLRQYLHSQRRLEELNDSPLANNLGVNILLFTADGSVIMQERSKKVAFRSGELCPSASGTMSLTDLRYGEECSLDSIPKLREAFEELGIHAEDIPQDQLFFLGVTRELIRGGEPELFFFGRTRLSRKELEKERWRDARDKWESRKLHFFHFGRIAFEDLTGAYKVHEFLSSVDDFSDEYLEMASVTLLANIALWVRYRLAQKDKTRKMSNGK